MHERNAVDNMNVLELRLCMFQSLSLEGLDRRHRTQDAIHAPDAIGNVSSLQRAVAGSDVACSSSFGNIVS